MITDLKNGVRRLFDELKKDLLLSNYIDLAATQSTRLAFLNAALQKIYGWPSACSTLNYELLCSEVGVGGGERDSRGGSRLCLSNRFAALASDTNLGHPVDPVIPQGVADIRPAAGRNGISAVVAAGPSAGWCPLNSGGLLLSGDSWCPSGGRGGRFDLTRTWIQDLWMLSSQMFLILDCWLKVPCRLRPPLRSLIGLQPSLQYPQHDQGSWRMLC